MFYSSIASSDNPPDSLRRLLNVSEDYDAEYFRGLARNHDISRTHGIDGALKTYKLDALVLPASAYTTTPPAKGVPRVLMVLSWALLTRPHSWLPHRHCPSGVLPRRHCSHTECEEHRAARARRTVWTVIHWHSLERVRAHRICVCV
jgi:hypothetical protein